MVELTAEETARFRDYLRSKWLAAAEEKTQWMTLGRAAEEIANIQKQHHADDAVIDAIRDFFADRQRVQSHPNQCGSLLDQCATVIGLTRILLRGAHKQS